MKCRGIEFSEWETTIDDSYDNYNKKRLTEYLGFEVKTGMIFTIDEEKLELKVKNDPSFDGNGNFYIDFEIIKSSSLKGNDKNAILKGNFCR